MLQFMFAIFLTYIYLKKYNITLFIHLTAALSIQSICQFPSIYYKIVDANYSKV